MSKTYIHKNEAKFKNNLLPDSEIPLNLNKKWDRHNFDTGYFRYERNKLRYKLKKQRWKKEINNLLTE